MLSIPKYSLKIILSLTLLTVCYIIPAQTTEKPNVIIKGKFLHPPDSAIIVLEGIEKREDPFVSLPLSNAPFTFTLHVDEPTLVWMRVQKPVKKNENEDSEYVRVESEMTESNFLPVFVEPGLINIEATDLLSTAKVTGSRSNKDWEVLYKKTAPLQNNLASAGLVFLKKFRKKDTTGMAAYNRKYIVVMQEINDIKMEFIKSHPAAYASIYTLWQFVEPDLNYEEINPLFEGLNDKIKNTGSGQQLAEKLRIAQRTRVGSAFTDFSQTDNEGKLFRLSSLKGKYIFVDFWASWCKPCREENPNLVKVNSRFHGQGLEVVGVSLDSDSSLWVNAIEKDKLSWKQVSDLHGWKNEAAKLYGIASISQNILIDTGGLVIARNLQGDALYAKIAELFK